MNRFKQYNDDDDFYPAPNKKRSRRNKSKVSKNSTAKKDMKELKMLQKEIIAMNKKLNDKIKKQKQCKTQSLKNTVKIIEKKLKLKQSRKYKRKPKGENANKIEDETKKIKDVTNKDGQKDDKSKTGFSFFGNKTEESEKTPATATPAPEESADTATPAPEESADTATPAPEEPAATMPAPEESAATMPAPEEEKPSMMQSMANSVGLSGTTSSEEQKKTGGKRRCKRSDKGKR